MHLYDRISWPYWYHYTHKHRNPDHRIQTWSWFTLYITKISNFKLNLFRIVTDSASLKVWTNKKKKKKKDLQPKIYIPNRTSYLGRYQSNRFKVIVFVTFVSSFYLGANRKVETSTIVKECGTKSCKNPAQTVFKKAFGEHTKAGVERIEAYASITKLELTPQWVEAHTSRLWEACGVSFTLSVLFSHPIFKGALYERSVRRNLIKKTFKFKHWDPIPTVRKDLSGPIFQGILHMFAVLQLSVRGGCRDPYKYHIELFVLDESTRLCFPFFLFTHHFSCPFIFVSQLLASIWMDFFSCFMWW